MFAAGWDVPEGPKSAAVAVGMAPPGTRCPSRGHGAETMASRGQGSQTTDTGLLNRGEIVAGLFPFLPHFQPTPHGELPDGLFGKEPFKFKPFFSLSCSKCYNPSGRLWCRIRLAIYFISQHENSSESPFFTTGVRSNSCPCRTQAETHPQYLGKSRKP